MYCPSPEDLLPRLPQACALPVRIVGTGEYLPARVVTAEEIDRRCHQPDGWTRRHTGVIRRHFVEEESAAFMGAQAVTRALLSSGSEIPDLLVCASGTPQQLIPCTAALVARELGWSGLPCYDINATCLGFLVALEHAAARLTLGKSRRVAIVCTEIASKGLNWKEPEAAALMGDGAAAVILTRSPEGSDAALLATAMETWPEGAGLTEIRGGGSAQPAKDHQAGINTDDYLFHMDGPKVFRLAAKHIDRFVTSLIGGQADRWDRVDWVIPHQASPLAIRHLSRQLGIAGEKRIEIAADCGNTIAASMPMALHRAIQAGKIQRGQQTLLLGTSAGFSLGGALLRY